MASLIPDFIKLLRTAARVVVLALLAAVGSAVAQDSDLPIQLDAGSWEYDRKNGRVTFEGIKITQGNLGIDADRATSSNLDFEDGTWLFTGNVRIRGGDADIQASEAHLKFVDNTLVTASISGKPAIFRQEGSGNTRINATRADLSFARNSLTSAVLSGNPTTFESTTADAATPTFGEASQVSYDFTNGVVVLNENARLSDGTNLITGGTIRYDTLQQKVVAGAERDGGQRVQITITPSGDTEIQMPDLSRRPKDPPQ